LGKKEGNSEKGKAQHTFYSSNSESPKNNLALTNLDHFCILSFSYYTSQITTSLKIIRNVLLYI
jgi:hypothetical protein